MERSRIWEMKECKDSCTELINYVELTEIKVSSRMKTIAKEISITCFIDHIEPNFENFKNRVVHENKIMNHTSSTQ